MGQVLDLDALRDFQPSIENLTNFNLQLFPLEERKDNMSFEDYKNSITKIDVARHISFPVNLADLITDDEQEKIASIMSEQITLIKDGFVGNDIDKTALKFGELEERKNKIARNIDKRYIVSLNGSLERLRTDTREYLQTITREEFLRYIRNNSKRYENTIKEIEEVLAKQPPEREAEEEIQELKTRLASLKKSDKELGFNFKSYIKWVLFGVRLFFNASSELGFDNPNNHLIENHPLYDLLVERAKELKIEIPVKKEKIEPITIDKPRYINTYRNTATDSLTALIGCNDFTTDIITGTTTVTKKNLTTQAEEFKLIQQPLDGTVKGWTMDSDKLLTFILNKFTEQNDFQKAKKKINNIVSFNVSDFASFLGTNNREASRKIKKELDRIFNSTCVWESYDKTKITSHIFSDKLESPVRGKYGLVLDSKFAQQLATKDRTITPLPYSLGKISGNNPNSYKLAKYMCTHYYKYNNRNHENQNQDNYNKLTIKKLLSKVDLPTYDKVTSNKGSWRQRIQDPLDDLLISLSEIGILDSFDYYLDGKEAKDLYSIPDYDSFERVIVKFEISYISEDEIQEKIKHKKEQLKKYANRRKSRTDNKKAAAEKE